MAATLTAAMLCLAAMSGCRSQPAQDNGEDNAAEMTPPPRMPRIEPPLSRARLLLAVAQAASAHSAGAVDADAQRNLDGKQFEVRLRFGCDGQGPDRGDHGWSVDPDGRTLRLRAVPTLSMEDEPVRSVAGDNIEAVEGFWLARPWLLQVACPAPEAGVAEEQDSAERAAPPDTRSEAPEPAPAPAIQRVGIARFYTPDDSRTGRRIDRPFEAVKTLDAGEQVGGDGFNLVLSGRLRARSDGRVILCTGSGRDRPPDCIVSADIDRVWIERTEDQQVLAEWTV